MQIDAEMLAKALETQIITIEFEHYKTGEILTTRATLDPQITNVKIVDQHPMSDVVAFWEVDESEWKSVYIDSIRGLLKNAG